jgi:hypothetical protein
MFVGRLITALHKKGYKIYRRPYELNIVGVRSRSVIPNVFDDHLHVFCRNKFGGWDYAVFPITTDPGTFWLRQPMEPQGAAILEQGQYVDVYAIDYHRGQYLALCQRLGAVSVLRDYDRDAVLDFNNGNRFTGWYGINIHHASIHGTTKKVDKYSGGCQVFANIDDFNRFMQACQRHKQLYGNKFTYTLIDLRALVRAGLKRGALAVGIGTLALASLFALKD